ncbi:MAG: hypothetical protein HWD61_08395 [Parachlamydiaceae bacterium]|nr:MAG: hypothetical protein HWD61_08395 [Parachlamydiaceae bacterium]
MKGLQKGHTQSTLSEEDWDAWRTYKYGYQSRHEWSFTSREMGLAVQKLDPDKIQEVLNVTFVPDVLQETTVGLATILSPEQVCALNQDQVYVLGSPPLIKNFIRLLVLGQISFEQLKNLETEKFQMIIDFSPEVMKYLSLGIEFKDLAAFSIFKLFCCLFRNPQSNVENQKPTLIQKF